jgi:phosphopantothenoylcysteine decarboxylase/phosphopantothenate--cysteine ligase
MNVRMWQHAATQRNLAQLTSDGVLIVGPNEGDMACGEFGPGRMAEPQEILAAIETFFRGQTDQPLAGLKALVTAGPTHEALDPVRYIANRSSGKQGYAIAGALAGLGAETTLVSGPTALKSPPRVKLVRVETAREMLAACEAALPANIAVMTAAVSDWRPSAPANQKIKKRDNGAKPSIALAENPDLPATIAKSGKKRPGLVVGFAAETEDVVSNAKTKLDRKSADWIVANDVSHQHGVMGGDANTVHLVSKAGVEDWPRLSKTEVATRLAARIAAHFKRAAE